MLKIKLFAVFLFLVFISGAFLFSGQKTRAQSGEIDRKPDGVLSEVAFYKLWRQVQKTESKADETRKTEPLTISDSVVLTG